MRKVYVAGSFRGDNAWEVAENIRAAERLGLEVCRMGAVAVIPHTMYGNFDGALPDEFFIRATLEIQKDCHATIFLPNWRKSEGSVGEHKASLDQGKPVFEHYQLSSLRDWLEENKDT